MDFRDLIINEGVKIGAYFIRNSKPKLTTTIPTVQDLQERLKSLESKSSEQFPQPVLGKPVESAREKNNVVVASACLPCSINHFSTSAGLLNEAIRFKNEGLQSNEVLDRIGKVLEEQNALERVDLTPEKLANIEPWEKDLAEEAVDKSRKLRHKLESITSIKELEEAAGETEKYYREINREWNKKRLAQKGESPEITALKQMVQRRKIEQAISTQPSPDQTKPLQITESQRKELLERGIVL